MYTQVTQLRVFGQQALDAHEAGRAENDGVMWKGRALKKAADVSVMEVVAKMKFSERVSP